MMGYVMVVRLFTNTLQSVKKSIKSVKWFVVNPRDIYAKIPLRNMVRHISLELPSCCISFKDSWKMIALVGEFWRRSEQGNGINK